MAKKTKAVEAVKAPAAPIRLDLGCGKNKREGFLGVDAIKFDGVDVVADLSAKKWPWKDGEVDEVNASHFVEHLTGPQRVHFVNELYRVLKPAGKATVITPHWASTRAYGDLTHQWPPVSEFWFYYLNKDWRAVNAPHNVDYVCDFDAAWGYSMNPALAGRNSEYQQFALGNYKEAAMDLIATLTKKVVPA
jgi:SAM-dependent methyltransferase